MSYPLRGLLFRLDPEASHELALRGLRAVAALPSLGERLAARHLVDDPRLAQHLFGRRFANPVGLAAGFDKDGRGGRARCRPWASASSRSEP